MVSRQATASTSQKEPASQEEEEFYDIPDEDEFYDIPDEDERPPSPPSEGLDPPPGHTDTQELQEILLLTQEYENRFKDWWGQRTKTQGYARVAGHFVAEARI